MLHSLFTLKVSLLVVRAAVDAAHLALRTTTFRDAVIAAVARRAKALELVLLSGVPACIHVYPLGVPGAHELPEPHWLFRIARGNALCEAFARNWATAIMESTRGHCRGIIRQTVAFCHGSYN